MRIFRVIFSAAVVVSTASAGLVTATGAHAATTVNYVALGDSYSSGLGAGDYISSSGSCDRSTNAYPEQWAGANSPATFTSVACSGATTADVLASQVSALSARTTLVSITIGGNDAGFASVMETCVLASTSTCLNAVAKAEAFVATQLPASLNKTLTTIRADAPSATVVVLGYPDLYDLSRSSTCIGLSTRDRTALNQGADDLDNALQAAAAANKDTFADVRAQFSGHEICDSGSWLHSVDIFAISSSYHPTAAGQELGYLPVFSRAA
ncbi:MAG TPA: SGNH/GDSL hydrolase family protein [Streptosporangiaceae bacterium]|nr:SGNH/GDSL hydrolase family protein [Streptosporangiaceae bacterium]